MILNNLTSAGAARILSMALPVVLLFILFFTIRARYHPRSLREWSLLINDNEGRKKLRERKRRLNAIRSRAPGAILPGIPTSQRDFALEPLIRNRKFKEAKAYILEQIRRLRDSPEGSSRTSIYMQYLELIEGTI
jgi:hypothetical protein